MNGEETDGEFEAFNMHLAPNDNYRKVRHKVRRGDTLGGLARRYHVSIAKLRQWNRSSLRIIRVGQTIIVSQSGSVQPYGLNSQSKDRSRKMAQTGADNNDSAQGI